MQTYWIPLFPANIYLFKFNNRDTRKRCEICSKLTMKTSERRQWRRFGVFIVNFEHIWHLFLVVLLLTLSKLMLGRFWRKEENPNNSNTPQTSFNGFWNKSSLLMWFFCSNDTLFFYFANITSLGKNWFSSYNPKRSQPSRLRGYLNLDITTCS